MVGEEKIIEIADSIMGHGKGRLNKCMETDAEVLEFGAERLLFTTDEFSGEDMLPDHNPYALGWNVTVGALSDILAMGGTPRYVAHALTVGADWNEKTVREFYRGTAVAVKEAGAAFIGGDVGASRSWRCTVSVIGSCGNRLVTRKGANAGDLIYLTGKVGLGNLLAALQMHAAQSWLVDKIGGAVGKFPVRMRESAFIGRFAGSCIDTSDGVYNGLLTLARLNDLGFALENPPYVQAGKILAALLSQPETLLLLGECGEYELLFTIDPRREPEFLEQAQAQGLVFYKLGAMTGGERSLTEKDKTFDLQDFSVRARDFPDVKTYLRKLTGELACRTS